ncbi:MAG: DNA cytosine methyltransferase [Christensenellales bacterium]
MPRQLTLGSLFDGSGGFPLGAVINGITPVWASEIEPFPIRVTTRRFPRMKHYGDISKLRGGSLEPVDIITFGSPCTDMSIAGKRAGLDGSQSVLFYEAIRVIREMREATHGQYPRFAVWENVPGAFSSNGGEDFKAVLDALVGVKAPGAQVPAPEGGRWPYADILLGDGWSLAYRTVDAQYFGVPQRRRRIYLVADFDGERAGEVLFEREGLSRDFAPGFRSGQGTAADAALCSGAAGSCVIQSIGGQAESAAMTDVMGTLKATDFKSPPCVTGTAGFCTEHSAGSRGVGYEEERSPTLRAGVVPGVAIENHPTDGRCKLAEDGKAQTLTSRMGTGGMNVPLVMNPARTLKIRSGCEGGGKGPLIQDELSATLGCANDQTLFVPVVFDGRQVSSEVNRSNPQPGDPCHTLAAGSADSALLCFGAVKEADDAACWGLDPYNQSAEAETTATLGVNCGMSSGRNAVCYGVCSDQSHAMLSSNPRSGIYEADTSRTLDANGGNPGCNQGGIAVVSYAMTTGSYAQTIQEQSPTLMSRDYKDAPIVTQLASFYPQMKAESQCFRQDGKANTLVNGTCPGSQNGLVDPNYIVRRLTPTECARLQGFPDDWCAGLETDCPTEEDIRFWAEVWETHRGIMGKSKTPKTRLQLIKWLRNPHSDAAEYKMWGNGVALPCVCFVLAGINDLLIEENT